MSWLKDRLDAYVWSVDNLKKTRRELKTDFGREVCDNFIQQTEAEISKIKKSMHAIF